MKIKNKLWLLATCILISIVLMTTIVWRRSDFILRKQVQNTGIHSVKSATIILNDRFANIETITNNVASTLRLYWVKLYVTSKKAIDGVLESLLAQNSNGTGLIDLYMGCEQIQQMSTGSKWTPPEGYNYKEQQWYTKAVESKKTILTDIYIDADTGKQIISVAKPLYDDRKRLIGVVAADIDLEAMTTFIDSQRIMGSGSGLLLNSEGLVITGPAREDIMKKNLVNDSKIPNDLKQIATSMINKKSGFSSYIEDGVEQGAFYAPTDYGFSLALLFPFSSVDILVRSLTDRLLLVSVLALLFVATIIFFISSSITKPISRIVKLAERAGKGDLTIERKDFGKQSKDEFGKMSDSLYDMIKAQKESIRGVKSGSEENRSRSEALALLSVEMASSMREAENSLEHLLSTSEKNTSSLEEANATVSEVAIGAQQTAENAEQVSEAIKLTMGQGERATSGVNLVIQNIKEAESESELNVKKIRELTDSVNAISKFVTAITNIADQTNLLALNAAIEAARAGDAGRGFAVVADEVRKLAEESAKAAGEVSSLIGSLQNSSNEAMTATETTGQMLKDTTERAAVAQSQLNEMIIQIDKVNQQSQDIAAVSEEQAASSEEMTSLIQNITEATSRSTEIMAKIQRATEKTTEDSEHVAEESRQLVLTVEKLDQLLEAFRLESNIKGITPIEK